MTKEQIITRVANDTHVSRTTVEKVIQSLLKNIINVVAGGSSVTFLNFGTFKPREVKGRLVRNPRNGDPVDMPTHLVPRFIPGKEFREKVYYIIRKE